MLRNTEFPINKKNIKKKKKKKKEEGEEKKRKKKELDWEGSLPST